MLFGTAGMLDEGLFREAVNDDYYLDLIKEYKILSAKYSLASGSWMDMEICQAQASQFPDTKDITAGSNAVNNRRSLLENP